MIDPFYWQTLFYNVTTKSIKWNIKIDWKYIFCNWYYQKVMQSNGHYIKMIVIIVVMLKFVWGKIPMILLQM